jgi:hypothetical protein
LLKAFLFFSLNLLHAHSHSFLEMTF